MPGALTNRFWSLRRDSARDISLIVVTTLRKFLNLYEAMVPLERESLRPVELFLYCVNVFGYDKKKKREKLRARSEGVFFELASLQM
jgi:hypothetical protein